MKLQRKGLRIIAAGAATVAVGVAVNQVLNGGKWNLLALVAAVVLAVFAEALNLWLGTHDKDLSTDDTPRPGLLPRDLASSLGEGRLGHADVGAPAVVRTLPSGTANFIGRTAELMRLVTAVEQGVQAAGPTPVHAIDGMPGVGKTAFAVWVAQRLTGMFPDGQLFMELHAHTPTGTTRRYAWR